AAASPRGLAPGCWPWRGSCRPSRAPRGTPAGSGRPGASATPGCGPRARGAARAGSCRSSGGRPRQSPVARSLGGVHALREHQLEALLQLQVARVLQRLEGVALVEVLLAAHAAAAAHLAGLPDPRPAAEQVAFEHQLHEARVLGASRALLVRHAPAPTVGARLAARACWTGAAAATCRKARRLGGCQTLCRGASAAPTGWREPPRQGRPRPPAPS